jgi:hypothetical protein
VASVVLVVPEGHLDLLLISMPYVYSVSILVRTRDYLFLSNLELCE